MTTTEILVKQTQDAYNWVNKLTATVQNENWEKVQKGIESSISWQVGHLVLSYYYHTIMVIKGHDMGVLKSIPMKEYSLFFGYGTTPKDSIGKVDINQLKEMHLLMQKHSIQTIGELTNNDLSSELHPSDHPHPIAKTKFEAIDWNIKHTMWHCGQIGTIKKILGTPEKFSI